MMSAGRTGGWTACILRMSWWKTAGELRAPGAAGSCPPRGWHWRWWCECPSWTRRHGRRDGRFLVLRQVDFAKVAPKLFNLETILKTHVREMFGCPFCDINN
ncbi:hypothetical protein DNTS_033536, partial [Danionella cerebrum]